MKNVFDPKEWKEMMIKCLTNTPVGTVYCPDNEINFCFCFSSLSNFQVTKELLKMERNEICGTDEPGFLFYKMYYM